MAEHHYVVLFADISGSMQLYESLGDESAKRLVTELQQRLATTVQACGGVVQEIVGDEIMVRLTQADAAAQCAAAIHQCAKTYAAELDSDVMMRIGMHWGLAIVENGRMFGDTVNVASRVSTIAQAGQTITTEALIEQMSNEWRAKARRFDTTKIKGKSEPIVVYDLPTEQDEVTIINQETGLNSAGDLILTYGSQSVTVASDDGAFSIGRALNNDLVVDASPVSRRHVTIERIRDKFVVSDKSTNGTHVTMANGEVVYLRREQLPIWGKGQLGLGAPIQGEFDSGPQAADVNAEHVVRYSCISGDDAS